MTGQAKGFLFMGEELKIAIVGGMAVIGTALVNGLFGAFRRTKESDLLNKHQAKINELQAAIKHAQQIQSIDSFIVDYDRAANVVDAIADSTFNNIDRVLIFKAINGQYDPTETTCIHEKRTGDQRRIAYRHQEIDEHYVGKVRETYSVPSILIKTDDLPEGVLLKGIYRMEGVTESLWIHLVTKNKENGKAEIYYLSMSTHDFKGISPHTITECEIAATQLRNFMGRF